MLFETPLLDSSKSSASGPKAEAGPGNKRRRSSVDGGGEATSALPVASFDVDKLLQKMQQPAPGPSAKGGKAAAGGKVAAPKQQQQQRDGPAPKRQKAAEKSPAKATTPVEEKSHVASAPATPAGEGKRAKKAKNKEKKAAAAVAGDDATASRLTGQEAAPLASTSRATTHEAPQGRHAAPSLKVIGSTLTGSTKKGSVQDKLRAQLAGGKFRMLNEQLYTTSGDDAHRLMKEDGAFDDYHIGFRSQAATWPVHPLALIAQALLHDLPPNSLIADFGCGDAALARTLCPPSSGVAPGTVSQLPPIPSLKVPAKAAKMKQLKVVSFDLVSQSSYVVEAECSSVPLPGGTAGGEVVDAVVCCLSLMGTDWIRMLREARRVLREGGKLKIAEVSSRFTSFDDFVKLVKELGFSLANKDESNTHFVLFDFVKQAGSDGSEHPNKVTEHDRKAATLLNPCIYKRR